MTTLQEYLNSKYPTSEDKEAVTKIATSEITEPLQGGELDLRKFKNLQEVIITNLTTPLTKIEVDGLIHLKELILPDKPKEETEEEKKLYQELGIAEDTNKKQVIQEVQRLAKIWSTADDEQIKVHFATEKLPQEKLGDKDGTIEKTAEGWDIYLQLDQNSFPVVSASLVFWTLARELTKINHESYDKDPLFWQHFSKELEQVKENLIEEYQKGFVSLLTPSTFPREVVDMKEFLAVYYPSSDIENTQSIKTPIVPAIVDKVWQVIKEKLIELLNQELQTNPDEEKVKELALKSLVDYQSEYTIQVNYQANHPLRVQIEQLITTTPLQLEIEYLKQRQEQLPTSENFDKLAKEKQELENYLQENTDTDTYRKIQDKMNKEKK